MTNASSVVGVFVEYFINPEPQQLKNSRKFQESSTQTQIIASLIDFPFYQIVQNHCGRNPLLSKRQHDDFHPNGVDNLILKSRNLLIALYRGSVDFSSREQQLYFSWNENK